MIKLGYVLLAIFCLSFGTGTFALGIYMMWVSGASTSFFGTLAMAFSGFCIWILGSCILGVTVAVSWMGLESARITKKLKEFQ